MLPIETNADPALGDGAAAPGRPRLSACATIRTEMAGLDLLLRHMDGDLGGNFAAAIGVLLQADTVIVTGIGKSGHIARKIAATFASTGAPSHFLHPAEASHGDLGAIKPSDAVLALSWSGESAELRDIVAYTRRFRIKLIAMTCSAGSALATAADIALILPRSPEACPNGMAPTTSTTMQLVLGDALAVALLERRGFSAEDFRQFHPGGRLGAQLLRASDLMHSGAALPLVALGAPLTEAIFEMTGKSFGITGIVDSAGNLAGVLTDGDLRRAFEAARLDWPLSALMTKTAFTVGESDLASGILAEMNARRITSAFVLKERRPAGIIHVHDLLRAGVK